MAFEVITILKSSETCGFNGTLKMGLDIARKRV